MTAAANLLPLHGGWPFRFFAVGECVQVLAHMVERVDPSVARHFLFGGQRVVDERFTFFCQRDLRFEGLNHPGMRCFARGFCQWRDAFFRFSVSFSVVDAGIVEDLHWVTPK